MWNAFAKILEHPQVQQVIATKILGIVDGVSDTIGNIFKKQPVAAAAIGTTSNATTMDENTKLQTAVGMLAQVDPQLGTHLLKLAEIAKADPAKYNMLIGMLKNF